jgi:hypothetical protein
MSLRIPHGYSFSRCCRTYLVVVAHPVTGERPAEANGLVLVTTRPVAGPSVSRDGLDTLTYVVWPIGRSQAGDRTQHPAHLMRVGLNSSGPLARTS